MKITARLRTHLAVAASAAFILAFAERSASNAQTLSKPGPQARGAAGLRPGVVVKELPGRSKRWALVIGIDQYEDSQIGTLRGAANDAGNMAEALIRHGGFPPDQVILLTTN